MSRVRFVGNLLGSVVAEVAKEAFDHPAETALNPLGPVVKGAFTAVNGLLVNAGSDQLKIIGERAEAQRNHHLKFAVASAVRVALADSKLSARHERLFRE